MTAHTTLDHPIFQRLAQPKADWNLLRTMALQGYQLTKNFLGYVERLYFYCPLPQHKRRLLVNLFEEETGHFSKTDNHVVLMQRFLLALGISDQERDDATAFDQTRELIEYRRRLIDDPQTYHMGAAAVMVASEGQNLETLGGEARDSALARLYGLSPEDLLFFSVHQAEDVVHVRHGIDYVVDLCVDSARQTQALEAVTRTCQLFRGMYDGIEARL